MERPLVHSGQPTMTGQRGLTLLASCRDAFLEWRKRWKRRAEFDGLSDGLLVDIGIVRGEIDYVGSDRMVDPRVPSFRREQNYAPGS